MDSYSQSKLANIHVSILCPHGKPVPERSEAHIPPNPDVDTQPDQNPDTCLCISAKPGNICAN